jgi:hypothetical protein
MGGAKGTTRQLGHALRVRLCAPFVVLFSTPEKRNTGLGTLDRCDDVWYVTVQEMSDVVC